MKTIDDIRKLCPCYDPGLYLPEDWTGTAIDILKFDAAPTEDRLWVVLRTGWIDDKTLRLFAVWCAREALKLVDEPDQRSLDACDVAERYANGEATDDELPAARSAARAAAWSAAGAAARDAAWSAAGAAAWYSAGAAAWYSAWSAAGDVARYAARYAASAAARDATAAWYAARDAARAAARAAARDAQVKKLIEMLEEG